MESENLINRIKSRFRREPPGPEDVIYKKLKQLQKTPLELRYKEQYSDLQETVLNEHEAVYNLLFSGKLSDVDVSELMDIGIFGVALVRGNPEHWTTLLNGLRERQDELPESVQSYLDWHYNKPLE